MFSMYYRETMMANIVKISHTRGQTLIGIPKDMAIAAGLDKCGYAFIWRTEEIKIHIKGITEDEHKERDLQDDRYTLDRSARGIVKA